MWCCCCEEQRESQNELEDRAIEEQLISQQDKNQNKAVAREEGDVQESTREGSIVNLNLEKMKTIQFTEPGRLNQSIEEEPMAVSQPKSVFRVNLRASDEFIKSSKKSELWLEEAGSKILYNCYQKEQEMLFMFKIVKQKVEESHPINYILQPLKYSAQGRYKPAELSICLITSPKSMSKFKATLPLLVIEPHIKPIFGLLRPDQEKIPKNYFESEFIYEVVNMQKISVRMESIDKIILSMREQNSFEKMLQFCQKTTEHFDLQDMTKITFIFPSFVSLSQICHMLSKLVRKFLTSSTLQTILKYLGYKLELIESRDDQFEQVIVVSGNLSLYEKEEMFHKQFQTKLDLALGLLMIEIDNSNFKIYDSQMIDFIMDKTIVDYLKFIQFVHKDKREFINQLEEIRIFDDKELKEIQNSRKIEENVINPYEKYIVLKHKNKKRLGDLFRDYRTTRTPVEQVDKKKEWDDDLKANDIQATIIDHAHHQKKVEANIFELINDDCVASAELDILPSGTENSDEAEEEYELEETIEAELQKET